MKSALLLLSIGLFYSSTIFAKQEINWVLLNFPPLMQLATEHDGEVDINKAQGPMADIQAELVKSLPEYQHRYHMVSFLRAKKLFESEKGYCTILFLKTKEREQYLSFGDTIARTMPPGLVMDKHKLEQVKDSRQGNALDLQHLLKKTPFQLGVVNGRSFSMAVDRAIASVEKPIFRMVTNEAMGSLFKMLMAQRIDGVLAYNLELAAEQERNPAAADLRFIPLVQERAVISLPVSCERSPWGQKTLGRISKALKDDVVKEKLAALVKRTLLTEAPEPALGTLR